MAETTKNLKGHKFASPVKWDSKRRTGDTQAYKTRGDDIVTRSAEPNTTSRTKSGLTTYPKPTTIKKDTARLAYKKGGKVKKGKK